MSLTNAELLNLLRWHILAAGPVPGGPDNQHQLLLVTESDPRLPPRFGYATITAPAGGGRATIHVVIGYPSLDAATDAAITHSLTPATDTSHTDQLITRLYAAADDRQAAVLDELLTAIGAR